MKLIRLIILFVIVLLIDNNIIYAQTNPFQESDSFVYIDSHGVFFYNSNAVDEYGHVRNKAKRLLVNPPKRGTVFTVENDITSGISIISYYGKKYAMSVGQQLLSSKPECFASIDFYPTRDLYAIISSLNGLTLLDNNGNRFMVEGATETDAGYSIVIADETGVKSTIPIPKNSYRSTGQFSIFWNKKVCRYAYLDSISSKFVSTGYNNISIINNSYYPEIDVNKESKLFQSKNEVDTLIRMYRGKTVMLSREIENQENYRMQNFNVEVVPKSGALENASISTFYKKFVVCLVKDIYSTYCMKDNTIIKRYFVRLSNLDSNCKFDIAYPLVGLSSIIMSNDEINEHLQELERIRQEELSQKVEAESRAKLVEEHRIEVAKESRIKEAEDRRKRAAYKQQLINKYGQSNAELILTGRVKLGFTKQMCREALGAPDQINTWSAKYNEQQWVYGLSLFLYFKGDILDDIQSFK